MATGDRRRLMRTLGIPDEGQIGLSPEPATTSTASTGTAGTDLLAVLTGAGSLASVIGQQVDAGNRKIEADLAEIKRQEAVNTRELELAQEEQDAIDRNAALQHLNTIGPRVESDIKEGNLSGTPDEITASLIPDGSSDVFREEFSRRILPTVSRSLEQNRQSRIANSRKVIATNVLESIGAETEIEDAQHAVNMLVGSAGFSESEARHSVAGSMLEIAARTGNEQLMSRSIEFADNEGQVASYLATYESSRSRIRSEQSRAMRDDMLPYINQVTDQETYNTTAKRLGEWEERLGPDAVEPLRNKLESQIAGAQRRAQADYDESLKVRNAGIYQQASEQAIGAAVADSFNGDLNLGVEASFTDAYGETQTIKVKDLLPQIEQQAMREIAESSANPAEQMSRSVMWYATNGVENKAWSNTIGQISQHAPLISRATSDEANQKQIKKVEAAYGMYKTLHNINPAVAASHTPNANSRELLGLMDHLISVSNGEVTVQDAAERASNAMRSSARWGSVPKPTYNDVFDALEDSKKLRKFEKLDNQALVVQRVQELATNHMQLGMGNSEESVKWAIKQISDGSIIVDGQLFPASDPRLPQNMDLAASEAKRLAMEQGATGDLKLTQYGETGFWEVVDAETGVGTGFSYTSSQLRDIVDAAVARDIETAKNKALLDRKNRGVRQSTARLNLVRIDDSYDTNPPTLPTFDRVFPEDHVFEDDK